MIVVLTKAIYNMLAPHRDPMAAEHHRVAAELIPRTVIPSLAITPAPTNPIPETIWDAILAGLLVSFSEIPTKMKRQLPAETRTFV